MNLKYIGLLGLTDKKAGSNSVFCLLYCTNAIGLDFTLNKSPVYNAVQMCQL